MVFLQRLPVALATTGIRDISIEAETASRHAREINEVYTIAAGFDPGFLAADRGLVRASRV
jgi:hypothetical protein